MSKSPYQSKKFNYDGGSYVVRVDHKHTLGQIHFRPYVVILKSFKKKHDIVFTWKSRSKTGGDVSYKYTYKGAQYSKPGASASKDARYYPTYDGNTKKAREKDKKKKKVKTDVKKKVKKGKNTKTVAVKAKIPTGTYSGWFYNFDPTLTLQVKVGSSPAVTVTFDDTGKPPAPENVDVFVRNLDFVVVPSKIRSSRGAPVRHVKFFRLEDDVIHSGNEWAEMWTKSYTAPGDEDGININFDSSVLSTAELSLVDTKISPEHRYKYKVQTINIKNGQEQTNTKENANWYYGLPPDVTNVTHKRIDDSRNRVSFTRDRRALYYEFITDFYIQVSNTFPIEEDAWVQVSPDDIITVDNGIDWKSQLVDDVSFIHKNLSKDTVYKYRMRATNRKVLPDGPEQFSVNTSPSYEGDTLTYNEPNPPALVEGLFDDVKNEVTLSITRIQQRTTADLMYIQRKTDKDDDWVNVGDDGITINPDIKKKPEEDKYKYVDNALPLDATSVKYRVSLGCSKTPADGTVIDFGNGKSDWTESLEVSLLLKPNPPTLILPINNSFITDEDTNVRLAWIHSPRDGTQQEGAKIEYRKQGMEEWTTINVIGAAAYYVLPLENFSTNDVLEWRVSTKGKHDDYSDFSSISTVKVIGYPKITIMNPSTDSIISTLPINLEWLYEDPSGELKSFRMDVIDSEEDVVHTIDLTEASMTYPFWEYLFDDNEKYTLVFVGTSTTGLSKSVNVKINIQYLPIIFTNGYLITSEFNDDTGFVTLGIARKDDSNSMVIDGATEEEKEEVDDVVEQEGEPITSNNPVRRALLYRSYRGAKTLIATFEDLDSENQTSDAIVRNDIYAPVNREFQYILVEQSTIGEVGISTYNNTFDTLWWYIYYGDGEIIKVRWNPTGTMSLSRPEKQQVRYSGRRYPVTYDSSAINETYNFNFLILDEYDEGWAVIESFRDMMENGGYGLWKSFEGDVYFADFDFNYNSDYTDEERSWPCSLSVTRTDEVEG